MQLPSRDETPPTPNVFVRPAQSWAVYQARLRRLLEEAGLRPGNPAASGGGDSGSPRATAHRRL
ncbi:MAG TPA: hypothetical protein VGO11_06840 [Chthoniobacteraceae bacterium]|nr:hypothetical protein [Chthoniobacteraceae bacterium]